MVLPLSGRLQAVFASRISDLPERTRRLLLLAALEGTGDLRIVQAAAGSHAIDSLAPAEQARLVHVDDRTGRLVFRHPLTRSAIVEQSASVDRRRAHRALADHLADRPERRAWHLAAAAAGPDEEAAGLLDQVAYHLRRRGDATGAVTALMRAADLSADGASRSRRLTAAANVGAAVTLEVSAVSRLLAAARSADPEPGDSLPAAVTAAHLLLNGDGDIGTVHRLLVGAIDAEAESAHARGDSVIIIQALQALMSVCYNGGRAELWAAFDAAVGRLEPHIPPDLLLLSRTIADPARTAVPVLGELDTAVGSLLEEPDHWRILTISAAALFPDRLAGCREALLRVVRDGRAGGAVAPPISALTNLSVDDLMAGRWDEAQQLADEGLELANANNFRLLTWLFHHRRAFIAAARGDLDTAQALADEIIQWAAPRGVGQAEAHARHVRVLAALAQGDFEDAYQHAAAISPPGVLASHVPLALWVAMDLVEAAVRTGRPTEAAAHVTAIRDAGIAALSPRLALLATASEAIAARDDIAPGLFEKALAVPGADRFPFDVGRVRLCYGERLRRARVTTEARAQLTAALEIFEGLGARPWATRATTELRATGRALRRDGDPLTPQELEIAELAAAGLSNKQIGQRLFLSHRTVGAHLYQIFPKLGVTSRAALRDALASLPPERPGEDPSQPLTSENRQRARKIEGASPSRPARAADWVPAYAAIPGARPAAGAPWLGQVLAAPIRGVSHDPDVPAPTTSASRPPQAEGRRRPAGWLPPPGPARTAWASDSRRPGPFFSTNTVAQRHRSHHSGAAKVATQATGLPLRSAAMRPRAIPGTVTRSYECYLAGAGASSWLTIGASRSLSCRTTAATALPSAGPRPGGSSRVLC